MLYMCGVCDMCITPVLFHPTDIARDAHCEITMGNDVARETHCDVTMSK